MTPAAATAAAERSAARRAAKTRVHRRVSGPARGAQTARVATAPSIPRRRPAPAPSFPQRLGPLALRSARRLRDSTLVDRLVRGRAWIALIAVLLIGLVGLNVSLLKLNAAAGRNAEWAKLLRIENADLQAQVSRLRSGQQIQAAARAMGFVMPTAGSVHYLTIDPTQDAARAASRSKLTAAPSRSDIVSAASDTSAGSPSLAPASNATGTTGTPGGQSATGTTGASSATGQGLPATGRPATGPAGATGAGSPEGVSQHPITGATVP